MILLYHRVFPDNTPTNQWSPGPKLSFTGFQRHIRWIKKHHSIISLTDYVNINKIPERNPFIALTFDDGLKETFDVVAPYLLDEGIPAVFFVSTSHLAQGNILWFNYLNAICYEKVYKEIHLHGNTYRLNSHSQSHDTWKALHALAKQYGDPIEFITSLSVKYPLPSSIISKYMGMTTNQLNLAVQSDLLEIGGHTCTHPYLDNLDKPSKKREIINDKALLEKIIGQSIQYFSYPSNAYDLESIKYVKEAGYKAAFSVHSKKLGKDPTYEIERVGIYSNSLLKLQMKLMGAVQLGRNLGLQVG